MLSRNFFTVLTCCLLGLSSTAAHAATGVVVRLVSTGGAVDGDVIATVVNTAGAELEFVLLDNGEAPDVFAGDNQYSASGLLDGTDATVYLTIGGEKTEVGEVAWQDTTTPRDLVITMGEGILTVETGVATPVDDPDAPGLANGSPPAGGAPGTNAPGAGGATGSGASGAPSASAASPSPARAPNVSFPDSRSSAQDDTTLYLLGGALVLVLALAAFLWLRTPGSEGASARASRHYTLQPEPGILGSLTPSLSDGLSTWEIAPDQSAEFLSLLLQGVAQHHRVLVVAPGEASLPLTGGGPIYRSREHSAVAVADAAISLMDQPGLPLAVLVWQEEIESTLLSDYATVLTPDVGVVALISRISGDHKMDVHVAQADMGWRVRRGDSGVQIDLTEWGVRVTPLDAPSAGQEA